MAARRSLDSDHGDPLTLLNAFREWLKIKVQEWSGVYISIYRVAPDTDFAEYPAK